MSKVADVFNMVSGMSFDEIATSEIKEFDALGEDEQMEVIAMLDSTWEG